jgi:hypothetical protein
LGKVVTEGLAPLLLLENQMKKPKRQCQIGKPLKHIIKQVRSFTSFQMVHTHTHFGNDIEYDTVDRLLGLDGTRWSDILLKICS